MGWRAKDDAAAPPPVLDEDYLARLAAQIGDRVLRELLADGLVEVSDRVERLREAAVAGDRRAVLGLAHDLTGIAGHLGLSALSRAAAACQQQGRSVPEADAAALAAPMIAAGPASCERLRRRLAPPDRSGA